jgi:predicted nuclease of predicted toxin-antitoxin system
LSLLRGAPPKVIWLVVGNTSTAEILRILLDQLHAIEAFINETTTALLALRKA